MKWLGIPLALAVGFWVLFLANHAPGTDAALRGFPLDDAWIHLVYARSLVTEGGLHYNPGQPETGMTSPLWVLLLAAVHAVVGVGNVWAVVLGTKVLSLTFGLAAAVLLCAVAQSLGLGLFVGVLAASLFALDPALSFARASGMEVTLFIALVLLALRLSLAGRVRSAAAAAGLAVVARPEGVVLFPVFAFALIAARRALPVPPASAEPRAATPAAREIVLASLLALLPALAYMLFCLHATGRPLPNTFYAKYDAHSPLSPSLLAFGWRNYVHGDLPYFGLEMGTVLALLGCARIVTRARWAGAAALASGALLFIAALASRRFLPGHFFYWERWIAPSYPMLLLAIAAGVEEVRTGLPSLCLAGRGTRAAWTAAALTALFATLHTVPGSLRERAETFAWNAQNIEEVNVALGRWVAAHLAKDDVIAVNDAGALRYFGNRTTIDLLGLNHHRLLQHDPSLGDSPLETLRVRYLIVFPTIYKEWVERLPVTAIHDARSPHYTICRAPQDRMVVYRLGSPLRPTSPDGTLRAENAVRRHDWRPANGAMNRGSAIAIVRGALADPSQDILRTTPPRLPHRTSR